MRILLTGFEPFGGESFNPSGACLELVQQQLAGTHQATIEELPVDWDVVRHRVPELLTEHQPDLYVALGLAPGRHGIAVERLAINVLDFPAPDNAGYQPIDEPIVDEGPFAYAATIPIKRITERCNAERLPMYVSNTAGTYLCNATMYLGLDWAARQRPAMRAGFIHLPHAAEYVPRPDRFGALPLVFMAQVVAQAIRVAAEHEADSPSRGGSVD